MATSCLLLFSDARHVIGNALPVCVSPDNEVKEMVTFPLVHGPALCDSLSSSSFQVKVLFVTHNQTGYNHSEMCDP